MIEQRSDEWFKQRVGKITGSRVGAILGLNPWSKPSDVMRSMVREYHGAENEFKGSVATEYGTKFEQFAQDDFEIEHGLDVVETGFHVKNGADWLGASPDGLIGDDAVLEIKCPYGVRETGVFKPVCDQLHYHAQVQIEMYCTNRQRAYFYQWSQNNSELEMIAYNQHWIDENLPKLKAFYDKYLEEIKAPDKHLAPLIKDKKAVQLAQTYAKVKQEIGFLTDELNDLKKQLIEVAGGEKSNISGVLVYEVERKGSIDYKKIPGLDGVDLEPYRKKPSKYWAVR